MQRIDELTKALAEKDLLLQQSIKEARRLRMELQNREENYNQIFGRQPNVGVINPLASRTSRHVSVF